MNEEAVFSQKRSEHARKVALPFDASFAHFSRERPREVQNVAVGLFSRSFFHFVTVISKILIHQPAYLHSFV